MNYIFLKYVKVDRVILLFVIQGKKSSNHLCVYYKNGNNISV